MFEDDAFEKLFWRLCDCVCIAPGSLVFLNLGKGGIVWSHFP